MQSVEREPELPVEKRAEEFKVTPELEEAGIKGIERAVTARVKDKKGKHLIQTSATKKVIIQLPTDTQTLVSWAKGPATNSLTWLAAFWLRMAKKAVHFGWRVVGGQRGQT